MCERSSSRRLLCDTALHAEAMRTSFIYQMPQVPLVGAVLVFGRARPSTSANCAEPPWPSRPSRRASAPECLRSERRGRRIAPTYSTPVPRKVAQKRVVCHELPRSLEIIVCPDHLLVEHSFLSDGEGIAGSFDLVVCAIELCAEDEQFVVRAGVDCGQGGECDHRGRQRGEGCARGEGAAT